MSIQLQMTLSLMTLLSMMILTALSKYIRKQFTLSSAIFLNSNHSASTSPIERLLPNPTLFSLKTLFTIELLSSLETTSVVEIRIHRPYTPILEYRVITQTPFKSIK